MLQPKSGKYNYRSFCKSMIPQYVLVAGWLGRQNSTPRSQLKRNSPSEESKRLASCTEQEDWNYFLGALGCCAGVAGWVFVGCDLSPCSTDPGAPVCLEAYTDNVMDVIMNATADHVVALESALAAPRGPKAVWLPWPPNAAEMSPLLPLCSRTTTMMKKQTSM